ncbi:hypothetical protein MRB53_040740 [Persea americana]|nr:hypothetical protein MRB53_040740 [Persea americana]
METCSIRRPSPRSTGASARLAWPTHYASTSTPHTTSTTAAHTVPSSTATTPPISPLTSETHSAQGSKGSSLSGDPHAAAPPADPQTSPERCRFVHRLCFPDHRSTQTRHNRSCLALACAGSAYTVRMPIINGVFSPFPLRHSLSPATRHSTAKQAVYRISTDAIDRHTPDVLQAGIGIGIASWSCVVCCVVRFERGTSSQRTSHLDPALAWSAGTEFQPPETCARTTNLIPVSIPAAAPLDRRLFPVNGTGLKAEILLGTCPRRLPPRKRTPRRASRRKRSKRPRRSTNRRMCTPCTSRLPRISRRRGIRYVASGVGRCYSINTHAHFHPPSSPPPPHTNISLTTTPASPGPSSNASCSPSQTARSDWISGAAMASTSPSIRRFSSWLRIGQSRHAIWAGKAGGGGGGGGGGESWKPTRGGHDQDESVLDISSWHFPPPHAAPPLQYPPPPPSLPSPQPSLPLTNAPNHRSPNLTLIASHHPPHTALVADILSLPHRPGGFDFTISIAVIHHLATRARRIAALAAVLAPLRPPHARALVYCWALEQPGSRRGWTAGGAQDVLVPWVMRGGTGNKRGQGRGRGRGREMGKTDEERSGAGEAQPEEPHAATPEHDPAAQDRTFHRFYHLYRRGELEEDVVAAGGRVVEGGSGVMRRGQERDVAQHAKLLAKHDRFDGRRAEKEEEEEEEAGRGDVWRHGK